MPWSGRGHGTSGFDHFVRSFLSSRARRGEDLVPRVLAVVAAPMHISHRAPATQRLPPAAEVERVEVMFREVWYDGARLHLLREGQGTGHFDGERIVRREGLTRPEREPSSASATRSNASASGSNHGG
jgi:hypothetical protein